MKKVLHFLLLVILTCIANFSFSQVTLVSDNTGISTGFVLPNGNPVLISHGGLLYTTDGSTATVFTTAVTATDTTGGAIFNGQIFFAGRATADGDVELWASDGTTGGTHLVKNIRTTGSSIPESFFIFNNTLYFTADDGVNGRELWSTNGITGNATLVDNIDGGSGSSITDDVDFFINGSNVFFKALDGASTLGLYKLTASGVSLVKNAFADDIELGASLFAGAVGNKVVFTAVSGTAPLGTGQLWVTDGTLNGTFLIKDFGLASSTILPQFVSFKNKLFFDGFDLTGSGIELWTTDGTSANTKLFKDLDPAVGASSFPILISSVVLNSKLYFSATTTDEGTEFWSTDGTAANTSLLKDINPGTESSNPFFLINVGALQSIIANGTGSNFSLQQLYSTFNGKMFFTADDGTNGTELWSSDGTSANTNIVKNIRAGTANGLEEGASSFFTTTGIYFRANNGTNGFEPWVTDGTSANTNLIADVFPGSANSNTNYLFIFNKKLYFTARNSGSDTDLYRLNTDLDVLPVGLSNFMAALQQAAVQLKWSTANEINADNFGVERSIDGANFKQLTTVAAKGKNGLGADYQYLDEDALHAGSSTLYYRLKMVDKDAKFSYSNVLKVTLHGSGFSYNLSPNPVHSQLTVSFAGGDFTQATVRVINSNGKAVYEKTIQTLSQGAVLQNINVAGLAGGVYYVQLITGNETKTLRFVKQ